MSNIWNRKIPTGLGMILLLTTILTTTFLVKTGVIYLGGAAPSENPQNIRITNITDTSLTVTYTTDTKVIGTIAIGQDKNNLQPVLDERDQESGMPHEYVTHSITARSLTPNTKYIFSVTSGKTTYLNHDQYFTVQTAPTLTSSPSSQQPVTGKIINPDSTIPTDALIYVTAEKGQIVSTLVKSSGIYTIPLNIYRTDDLQQNFAFQEKTPLYILATDGTNTSQATVSLSGSSPVPLITLSQTYNFVFSTQPLASDSAKAIGFPVFSSTPALQATPEIITPQKDEGFNDAQPRFSGKALPNQAVTIEIHSSDAITATVTADALGNWSYRPTQQLAPGTHTITIMTPDANGALKTIQQSFTVYAEGTQLAQAPSISPSQPATPTPTPTQSPTRAPSPTVTPSAAPTISLTPTASPTRATSSLTPKPSLPPTGSNTLVVAGTTGIVTTLIGIVLFLISRGALL